jgi:hypothetical protein
MKESAYQNKPLYWWTVLAGSCHIYQGDTIWPTAVNSMLMAQIRQGARILPLMQTIILVDGVGEFMPYLSR